MDRTSSLSRKSSHESRSDDRIEKPVDGRGMASHIDSTSEHDARRPPSVSTVTSLVPAQPASSTASLQPLEEDNAVEPENAEWTTVHEFSDVPAEFITAFRILLDVEQSAWSKHNEVKHPKKDKTEIAEARKFIKRNAKEGKSSEGTEQYQLLRGSRTNKSGMEDKLPATSEFRALLYPATGGIRDTRTGLYAELRRITTDDRPVYLLCFPGTGVTDNQDTQWKSNVKQALGAGKLPRAYVQALDLAQELKTALEKQGIALHVTGHSMGGGLANFVGLALNLNSYCFNAAALGKKSLQFLMAKGCMTAERINRQSHVTLKGDFASSSSVSKVVGVLSGSKQAPRQIGKVYLGTEEHEDFPSSGNALTRHPLSAMENMMDAQKFLLWKKSRQSAATNARSAPVKPVGYQPQPSQPQPSQPQPSEPPAPAPSTTSSVQDHDLDSEAG